MTNRIRNFLKSYSFDTYDIDKLLISAFVKVNNYIVNNNRLLLEHIIEFDNDEHLNRFVRIIKEENIILDEEQLISLFEFVISPAEKEVNGAIYTPAYIRDYIVEHVIDNLNQQEITQKKYADISCGCGGFFFSLIKSIKARCNVTVASIISNCIYGVDIAPYSIQRTKLLLSLLALSYGEDQPEYNFNLFVDNSLSFDWTQIEKIRENGGFDVIIGNPPYVSSSKIDSKSKLLLENWSVSKTGKTDLYIPFFQIAIESLRPNGILGYITVNNFYRSLNGRAIRQYFADNSYYLKFIDFGSEQVFRGRSTYTCICFIHRTQGYILYTKSKSKEIFNLRNNDFIPEDYNNLNHHEGWILQNDSIREILNKIENTGKKLGHCFDIKNGFATLKNEVYLFKPTLFDSQFYYFTRNGKEYKIEKGICRDAIKPNTLKKETDIKDSIEKLIFPYNISEERKIVLISDDSLKKDYPNAYDYLLEHQEQLANRDKGTRIYENWYAYGRNQAITINGFKLMFPYISDYPYFVFSDQRDLLFYNGYALVSNSKEDLLIAQKVLMSKLFWFYIKHTSKPYGSNYFALAKNYVKNFGYFQFDLNQRQILLNAVDSNFVDQYLCELYRINYDDIL